MKHIQRAQIISLPRAEIYDDGRRTSLSEQTIVSLQNALLRPGFRLFRGIPRDDLALLIQTIAALDSSRCGALITAEPENWQSIIQQGVYLDFFSVKDKLHKILMYDFLIIDGSQILLLSEWFAACEEYIAIRGISQVMPLIMLL